MLTSAPGSTLGHDSQPAPPAGSLAVSRDVRPGGFAPAEPAHDDAVAVRNALDRAVRLPVASRAEKSPWNPPTTAIAICRLADPEKVVLSPDRRVLAASFYTAVEAWDTAANKRLPVLNGHAREVWGMALSPNGSLLATASWDQTVRLWDTATGAVLRVIKFPSPRAAWRVAFSPDGALLAVAGQDQRAWIWDMASGAYLHELKGHTNQVEGVAFSPDGKMLATASQDGSVRLWDPFSGKPLRILNGHINAKGVAFSPDGTMLASTGNDIRLWNPLSGKSLHILDGHGTVLSGVGFIPGSNLLAVGGYKWMPPNKPHPAPRPGPAHRPRHWRTPAHHHHRHDARPGDVQALRQPPRHHLPRLRRNLPPPPSSSAPSPTPAPAGQPAETPCSPTPPPTRPERQSNGTPRNIPPPAVHTPLGKAKRETAYVQHSVPLAHGRSARQGS